MFVPIANEPRDYAWGSTTLLSEYLGRTASGAPEAELWLGAHAGCPAVVTAGAHAGTPLGPALEALGARQPAMLPSRDTLNTSRISTCPTTFSFWTGESRPSMAALTSSMSS